MGFANPFLYHTFGAAPSAFHDVTLGKNNVGGRAEYPATTGYDMATGLGSPDAMALATALAGYSPAPVSLDHTTLTASPGGPRTLHFGQRLTFSGAVRATGGPIDHAKVYLQLEDSTGIREFTRLTNSSGGWQVTLSTSIDRRAHWHVVYLGTRTQAPALKIGYTIYVIPSLTLGASLPLVHGYYQARAGGAFTLSGRTMRQLVGRPVVAEYRPAAGTTWARIGPATVTSDGLYHRVFSFPRSGSYVVRWIYEGSTSSQWLSGASPGRLIVVHAS
jgi:hypothetical protein